jgi:hypothetical protein
MLRGERVVVEGVVGWRAAKTLLFGFRQDEVV